MKLFLKKKQLRNILVQKRSLINKNTSLEFSEELFNQLIEKIIFKDINFISSFISIRSEISTIKLNERIIKLKKILSFPVIEKNSKVLIFKKFNSNENLKLGKFHIPEPSWNNDEVIPQLFFVPCLGFDLIGNRIGYGGGYYDRTFAKLKELNLKFYTVGFAYDEQKQNEIPVEYFDYKLDFVLTEKQLYTFI